MSSTKSRDIPGTEGIFAVYKPVGPTSNQVLSVIRKVAGTRVVGHAGTLDPLASGVLVIGIGREATKKLRDIIGSEKEYVAEVRLGATSTTDDEEGEKTEICVEKEPATAQIKAIVESFTGNILQAPPQYSAIKVRGERAYKIARRGKSVNLGKRSVEIKSIEVLGYAWPVLKIRTVTGSGTYIRSLARDIGEKLGVGGYLAALERTRVGSFRKEDAVVLEDLNWVK